MQNLFISFSKSFVDSFDFDNPVGLLIVHTVRSIFLIWRKLPPRPASSLVNNISSVDFMIIFLISIRFPKHHSHSTFFFTKISS